MNNNNRTKNAMLIMITGLAQRLLSIIFGFISQWAFFNILGFNYAGLDGLFSSILSYLTLAELGIGSAITVHLYKPIASNDKEEIKSLMAFYKKCYVIIGWVVFLIGLCIMPFLPKIVNFNDNPNVNLYFIYFILLVNTCLTYWFFAYKSTIIRADQKGYIINKYETFLEIGISVSKFLVIYFINDYVIALLCETSLRIISNLVIAIKANSLYPFIKEKDVKPLNKKTIQSMFKDVKSLLVINISNRLINATDNIVISSILGTVIIGHTYLYNKIIAHITTLVNMLTTSFESSIGNLIYKEKDSTKQLDVYNELNLINYWLACFSSACLFSLINPFITLFYSNNSSLLESVLSIDTVACIVLHFYFTVTNNNNQSFRNAFGLLRQGWWILLVGGISHIWFDIVLAKKYGLLGIYFATLICDIFIIYIPNIFYLFRDGLKSSYVKQLIISFSQTCFMILVSLVNYYCVNFINYEGIFGFILKVGISLIVPNILLLLVFFNSNSFKSVLNRIKQIIFKHN